MPLDFQLVDRIYGEKNMAETNRSTDGWENILAAAKEAMKAYAATLKASDALAEAMGYWKEDVLRQVLPQKSDQRRETKRILEWVNGEQDKVELLLNEREIRRKKQAQVDALLAKLKLTPEEKKLLGITLTDGQ